MYRRLLPVLRTRDMDIEQLRCPAAAPGACCWTAAPRLELGRGSDDEVLERTAALRAHAARSDRRYRAPLEYADLRHADGYAVRLRGVTTTPTAPPAPSPLRTLRKAMAKEYKDLVFGLDIGTAKVMVVAAEVHARRRAARGRPGRGAHARPQARRGGQHRRHRAEHPAGAEGGRDDGRLQDRRASTPASPAATSAARTAPAWSSCATTAR
jgi:hypothetical protein